MQFFFCVTILKYLVFFVRSDRIIANKLAEIPVSPKKNFELVLRKFCYGHCFCGVA